MVRTARALLFFAHLLTRNGCKTEKAISPHQFAVLLCEDLDVPDAIINLVSDSIRTQLEGYRTLYSLPAPDDDGGLVDISVRLPFLPFLPFFDDSLHATLTA